MSKQVAWSYSRLSSFETCPRKYWAESVGKTVPFVKNDQALYGDEVHKAFANFFRTGQKLPLHLLHWTPVLQKISDAPGEKVIEQQIALDINYAPVEWFAKDAWLRVISDLTQINGTQAVTWDWKTGRESQDFTQLKLNAAVTFHLDQNIEEITMAYLWLKTKRPTVEKIKREQASDVWSELLPRVARYQQAHDEQNFPPRQCFLCKGYCPVKTCQFWEPKR